MGSQVAPKALAIGGLVTKGSPVDRPPDSSVRCRDLRIMPGAPGRKPYLRLRGGKKRQYVETTTTFNGLFEWSGQQVSTKILGARNTIATGITDWVSLSITGAYSVTSLASAGTGVPITASPAFVRTKVFLPTNTYGRGASSVPPLRSWDGTLVRHVGLDAFLVGGNPTATFAAGAGSNTILTSVDIWVGIYNTTTGHFSNAVFAGRLSTPGAGTITVANLGRLVTSSNNATELAELRYTFFASIDGGETAYNILNPSLNGPFVVSIGTGSTTLSITGAVPQGFFLDLTQERPFENYPPRPMFNVVYAGGRVYGIPAIAYGGTPAYLSGPGGSVYADFTYLPTKSISGAIVFSASSADVSDRAFTGVPEESWPLRNVKYTPNGQQPVHIDVIPGTGQVLVLTANATYLLTEMADGTHVWSTVSDVDGMSSAQVLSFASTPRGPIWLTQNNVLVMLDKDSHTLRFLSDDFDDYLIGLSATAADYLRDPRNDIDYYEVWAAGGRSIIYDFAAGGVAWEKTTQSGVTAARSMKDSSGNLHHMYAVAATGLFTQEADPYTGIIATRDELATAIFTDPSGDYISQWLDFGDHRDRKALTDFDIIGDGEVSDSLTVVAGTDSVRPLTVTCYTDLGVDEQTLDLVKSGQAKNNADFNYKARRVSINSFWVKFRVQIVGHSADGVTTYSSTIRTDSDIPPPIYGCIYEIAPTCTLTGNRA